MPADTAPSADEAAIAFSASVAGALSRRHQDRPLHPQAPPASPARAPASTTGKETA